ncbi:hypothetical protein TNCV_2983991 [Trichonephila clavipes]|nr:hypothetical protein TNCV_2983991 [Trichonephila clavipes]
MQMLDSSVKTTSLDSSFIAPLAVQTSVVLRQGFCEGDTRNRWRDGQVCPDVDKDLWRLGPDGSGKKEEKRRRKSGRENGQKEDKKVRTRVGDGKRESGRESEARLEWRKGLSPELE